MSEPFWPARRLDRYLLRAVLLPFTFSVVVVVVMVFLLQVERLANAALGLALSARDAAAIFVAALPPFMVLTIPIAYLLSVLVGMSRLSADLELTALRAAGASPWRLAAAPVLLGLAVSLACLPLAHLGEPYGLRLLYAHLVDLGLRNITQSVQPGVFNEDLAGITLYARARSPEGVLQDVLLYDERDAARPVLITAAEGALRPQGDREILVTLEEGEIHLREGADEERYDRVRFARSHMALDVGGELVQRTRFLGPKERMTSPEMIAEWRAYGPQDRYGRNVEKAFWRRFAFPSMAFVFGVVGAAIALGGGPRSRARSAVLAMLAVLLYYFMARIGDYAVNVHPGTPFLAAFVPNAVMLALGTLGVSRSGRPAR